MKSSSQPVHTGLFGVESAYLRASCTHQSIYILLLELVADVVCHGCSAVRHQSTKPIVRLLLSSNVALCSLC
jgi:hypothetical protein